MTKLTANAMYFKRLDDLIAWPKVAEDDLVQLLETNVSRVLTEALSAHVQVVLPKQKFS